MRAKLLLTTISVLSLGIFIQAQKANADDSYVNLSVLDNLEGTTSSGAYVSKPLFPIISAEKSTPTPKKAKPKKKTAVSKKSETKIEVPAKKAVTVTLPQTAEKQEMAKPVEPKQMAPAENEPAQVTQPAQVSQPVTLPKDTPFKVQEQNNVAEKTSPAPSTPVVTEELPNVNIVQTSTIEGKQQESLSQESQSALPAATSTPAPKVESLLKEEATEPEVQPKLLVNTAQEKAQDAEQEAMGTIYFAEDADELTEENKAQIDAIIATFADPNKNKIGIYPYNLENGEDSFRKKRTALNRAIATRSYLLSKGYKNYSIKLVNLTEANGKENSVLIEELK